MNNGRRRLGIYNLERRFKVAGRTKVASMLMLPFVWEVLHGNRFLFTTTTAFEIHYLRLNTYETKVPYIMYLCLSGIDSCYPRTIVISYRSRNGW